MFQFTKLLLENWCTHFLIEFTNVHRRFLVGNICEKTFGFGYTVKFTLVRSNIFLLTKLKFENGLDFDGSYEFIFG